MIIAMSFSLVINAITKCCFSRTEITEGLGTCKCVSVPAPSVDNTCSQNDVYQHVPLQHFSYINSGRIIITYEDPE